MSQKALSYHIVDAFAIGPFTGNPAGVVVLSEPLSRTLQQQIAIEFNLPVVAYLIRLPERGVGHFAITWFAPHKEVPLCGHGTLAAVHVLINENFLSADDGAYHLHTRDGNELYARPREDGRIQLDFPAEEVVKVEKDERTRVENAVAKAEELNKAMEIDEVWKSSSDVIVVMRPRGDIYLKDIKISLQAFEGLASRGAVLTTVVDELAEDVPDAPQVYSRALFPASGEDVVCGSAHCALAIVHSPRFGGAGTEIRCGQGYEPVRAGALRVAWDGKPGRDGGRVTLSGNACIVATGNLFI